MMVATAGASPPPDPPVEEETNRELRTNLPLTEIHPRRLGSSPAETPSRILLSTPVRSSSPNWIDTPAESPTWKLNAPPNLDSTVREVLLNRASCPVPH